MAAPSGPPMTFSTQERVLCYHGPLIYEAKIMKTKVFDENHPMNGVAGQHYLVHYKGWKQTWDEWVPPDRLLKINDESLTLQKHLQGTNAAAAGGGGGGSKTHKTGASGINKDNANTRTAARKDGTRGTKRAREEDESSKKPEMKLTIPEILKVQLVDDWECCTKNNQLLTLPREPNVADVLAEFAEYIKTTKPAHLKEPVLVIKTVIDGLQAYFDRALGNQLLYRFERPQYADIRKKYFTGQEVVVGQTEKEMSYIYGAEHLLRMMVSLPQMIATTSLDPESVQIIRDYSNELLLWMVQEKGRIFQQEYQNASPEYQARARS